MTIAYPNGTVRNAILVSQEESEIRAIVPGSDDVLLFTRIEGFWISENLEPVTFEFEWQRRVAPAVPREEDCICSKELAEQLMATLLGAIPSDDERPLYVFDPAGARVAIPRKSLIPN